MKRIQRYYYDLFKITKNLREKNPKYLKFCMLHQYFLPELIKMVGKVKNKIVGNVIPHFFQIVGNVIRPAGISIFEKWD